MGGRRVGRARVGSAALVALLGALMVPIAVTGVAPVGATTSNVSTSAAFRTAFGDFSVDVINLTADILMTGDCGTYTRFDNALTVNGNGFRIDASSCALTTSAALRMDDTTKITFNNITITGASRTGAGSIGGGAIQSNGSEFNNSTVRDNTVTSSAIGVAIASGGGIYASGTETVTLRNSTVSGNTVSCAGCTVNAVGGGIQAGTVTLINSTVNGNSASSPSAPSSKGGGVFATNIVLAYSTVASNTATVGANISGTNLTSFASVVALPVTGSNCSGFSTTSEGYNHEDNTSCGFGVGPGDQPSGGNPNLGALGASGGPTQTRYPTASSPLLEKVPAADCVDGTAAAGVLTDQRGLPRLRGRGCDIGAVERPAGRFVPVDPTRILDTRPVPLNTGGLTTFGPGQTKDLQVTGAGPVPGTGVAAVLLNVTATNAGAPGWLTLFPADTALATASNLNFSAGQTVPNLVTVQVASDDGKVSINNSSGLVGAGNVDVIADVVGYYYDATQPSPGDVGFFPLDTPVRILDTRSAIGLSGAFTPQEVRTLDVDGSVPTSGVPVDAAAVVMNVTATSTSAAGWLTLFPANLGAPPTASNLNFTVGQTVPNLVTVSFSSGDVKIANTFGNAAAGTTHVVGDVVGYYRNDYTGGTLVPTAPQRILDTRNGTGGVTGPVAGGATIQADPQTATGIPAVGEYGAVVVNVTATAPSKAGWLTAFSSDDVSPPTASNLNFLGAQTVPNLVKAKVGTNGKFKITNSSGLASPGTVQIVVDLVGYFTFDGSL